MSKYIWLNKKQEMPTAIILDRIDSLQIRYMPCTEPYRTPIDEYVLCICTASKTYTEEYSTQREAKNRMDEILSMIEG